MAEEKQAKSISKNIGDLIGGESRPSAEVKDTGKMVVIDPDVVDVTDIKPTDSNKILEFKVYRKWTSRNVPDLNPTGLCFILLDKHVSKVTVPNI